ncbi:uncharacterized protein YigA (DUF484 family) [Rhizomicrobium palustre]|uniref:Uncharacterized protein YigA (DUF484 family) n=1 Tax=Rhizomicrobium palustre TaxID=189966 RepID=A0A846MXH9_9PROT|nr:DUF484 family protein [Rhizomicrobium palustre]NIK88278.1 uncharacterized protein YigA (DUF484 family) [Rhizomicrobium palustre]
MSESAPSREPLISAADAVKAYIRLHRDWALSDGELLSLLLPERFQDSDISDLQRYAMEKLRGENQALRAELLALQAQPRRGALSEGVKKAVLDLIDARSFAEAIAAVTSAAPAFGADRAVFCIEAADGFAAATSSDGVRLIAPGTVAAVVGPEGMGAILSGGGELLFGRTGYRSIAAFRLRIGASAPPALFVLGSRVDGRFDGQDSETDLGFFARALERAIRAWLDLPKA